MKFLLIALMFFVPDADTPNYKMDTDNPSYRMKIGNENETGMGKPKRTTTNVENSM